MKRDNFTKILGKYGLSDEQINELEREICQLFKVKLPLLSDEEIQKLLVIKSGSYGSVIELGIKYGKAIAQAERNLIKEINPDIEFE